MADRGQRARTESQASAAPEASAERIPQRDVTRIRSRVAAGSETQSFSQGDLPSHSRSALQSYRMNGPSLSERLGVELAGIDVLV